MTDQDRKLHRGNLLVSIEDAEEELKLLCGEAFVTAKGLAEIAERITDNARLEPSPSDFIPEGDIRNRLTPTQFSDFPKVDSVTKLIEDMKKARQAVFDLRKLKRA
jgi:hypothetical protein